MSAQQGGGQQGGENAYTLLWVLAGVTIFALLIWYFFQVQLIKFFLVLKKFQLLIVTFFTDNKAVSAWLEWIDQAQVLLAQGSVDFMTVDAAGKLSTVVGNYWQYGVCPILAIMAIVMWRGHATMRFNRAHNMNTLAEQEQKNWPQIAPIVNTNLVEEDINQGPWAMAMNPMQFAKKHKLLDIEYISDPAAPWRADKIPKAKIKKDRAFQVFATQLGPLWDGVDKLPKHIKALYAVFLARAEHQPEKARKYLDILAASAARGDLDTSLSNEYIKKYGNCKAAKRCLEKHAYVATVMASMLELARLDGVLASADFLWLKAVDRRLWYVLNTVGRQVAPCEIAGIFAHWLAEKEMSRPLSVPLIDEAVNALEIAINNTIYVPDEDEGSDQNSA